MLQLDQKLNNEVLGVETKHILFGCAVISGCFAMLCGKVATWEQLGPVVTLVVGFYFGRNNTKGSGGSDAG